MIEEELQLGVLPEHTLRVRRPRDPDQLLDLAEVHARYAKEEYMPYWATLWPMSRFLARFLFSAPPALGTRTVELGCGLGLAGCAALKLGAHVTFTDWDESTLEWAAANARLNLPAGGGAAFCTRVLDWRQPPAGAFDLVLASDVSYEARNVEPLVAALGAVLAPGGLALVADQDRPYSPEFKRALAAGAYRWEAHPVRDSEVKGTIYTVRHG